MKKYIALLSVLLLSSQANAAITNTWTDEVSFLSANTGLSMESFERTSSSNLPLVAGDITVSTDNTSNASSFNGTNSNASFGITDGVQNVRVGLDDGDSIWFDFTSGISVFGINIWGFGTTGGNPLLTFFDDNGNSQAVLAGTRPNGQEFFGVAIDTLFTRVQFQLTGATGDGIYFDEAYYGSGGSTPQVPIPAAAFMFAPALLGFLGLRRRAKNNVA